MEKDIDNANFGRRVAVLRHERGISQGQLSFDSGINRTYMGAVERGEKCPSLKTIIKIANFIPLTPKCTFPRLWPFGG